MKIATAHPETAPLSSGTTVRIEKMITAASFSSCVWIRNQDAPRLRRNIRASPPRAALQREIACTINSLVVT
jgi:hypothetical protein